MFVVNYEKQLREAFAAGRAAATARFMANRAGAAEVFAKTPKTYEEEGKMEQQEMFERAVSLGLRAAIVVLQRGEGIAGIERLIWQAEHPARLADMKPAQEKAR